MEYQIRNIFIENLCTKCAPKAVPVILVNNTKQPLHARNYFQNKTFRKRIIKNLKRLSIYFSSNPVSFNGLGYEKQNGLELVTSHSSGYKTSSE